MAEIARWTTPSITYKPSMVEMENVDEIYLIIKQGGNTIIQKSREDCEVSEDGFIWWLSQEETSLLLPKRNATVQVDYTSAENRYTTIPKQLDIGDSGINGRI